MPRIYCPECDSEIKVPVDYERASIRCDSCGKNVSVDRDLSPRTNRPTAAKPFGANGCLLLAAYAFTIVGVLVCVCVAFLQPGVAMLLGVLLGMLVTIVGFIGYLMARYGAGRPFLSLLPWIGLLLLGGVIVVAPIGLFSIAKNMGWFGPPAADGDNLAKGPPGANDPKAKDADQKPPPDLELPKPKKVAPLKMTGDAAMDKTLTDLANPAGKNFKPAADRLIAMPPDEHRAIVAQHLAERLAAAPLHARTPLLRALGKWGTAEEVPTLLPLLKDADINTRNETLQTLGKIRDERAAAPMVRCLLDNSTQYHAEQALKAMGPIAEPAVLGLLKEQEGPSRVITIRILAEIGTEKSVPALDDATKEVATQSAATQALAAIRGRAKK